MEANIVYCRDSERYYKLLDDKGIYNELRLTRYIKKYLTTLVVAEQQFSKRGLTKYIVISFIDYNISKEETERIIKLIDDNAIVHILENSYVTSISIYSNNLTDIIKSTDILIKQFKNRLGSNVPCNDPKICLSTDLIGKRGITYYCRDLISLFETFQIIKLDYQQGEIYLDLNEVQDEFLVLILKACINTDGRVKIYLNCKEYERELWIERAKYLMLEKDIHIDFSKLDKIVQRKEFK